MASGIRLYSTETLADFVADLGRFTATAADDLAAAEGQLQRVTAYLQDRLAEARGEDEREIIRRHAARVEEAGAEFRRASGPLRDLLADGTGQASAFLVARREAIERYLSVAAGGAAAGAGVAPAAPTAGAGLVGAPVEDAAYWHRQSGETCAVVAQEQIIRKRTGEPVTEDGLLAEAIANHWFDDGTPASSIGKLCQAHGLTVTQTSYANGGMDVARLREHLARGDSVIVGVDAGVLWNESWAESCGHAVWVTGVDDRNVYMNDSGNPAIGGGGAVPIERFTRAWSRFGNLAVVCTGP